MDLEISPKRKHLRQTVIFEIEKAIKETNPDKLKMLPPKLEKVFDRLRQEIKGE